MNKLLKHHHGKKIQVSRQQQTIFCNFYGCGLDWASPIDAFIREENRNIFYESVKYCQENKGLKVYGYCIMTSHIHMIIGIKYGNLSTVIRDLKSFTSRQIRKNLETSTSESRREWMLWMFGRAGKKNERNIDY